MSAGTTLPERARAERLRLMAAVARLYHVHHVSQREIGERVGMSQARVSRMLRQAEGQGIVATVVAVPDGLHPELEEVIERDCGVTEVHVVEIPEPAVDLARHLGRAAARFLVDATVSRTVIGFTSWSRTLQEMAFAFPIAHRADTRYVVEMLGDLGSPVLQHAAAGATQTMARTLGAEAIFLRTPGVVATAAQQEAALRDVHVLRALRLLDELDLVFIGVGPPALHSHLEGGHNYFTPEQLATAKAAGAAGQINQRFIDGSGGQVTTHLDALVVGSTLEQIAVARRRVVVAGGIEKHEPIAAALRGGWVDVLVTDVGTANFLTAALAGSESLAMPNARS